MVQKLHICEIVYLNQHLDSRILLLLILHFIRPTLKISVSPYPTLLYQYGSVGRNIFLLLFQIRYPLNLIVYSKTCLKRPLTYQDRLSHNAGQKYCRMLPFCNTFDLYLVLICLSLTTFVNLCISLSGRFRQVLLHSPTIGNKIKYKQFAKIKLLTLDNSLSLQ